MAASIFISYAHEDHARAEQLAGRFARAGWSVWWDRQIVGGKHFDKATEEAIAAAKVVVVLWSRASVASQWVRAEAAWALKKEKLLPVKIDDVDQPLEFFHVQTIDLTGWNSAKESPALGLLLTELGQRLGDVEQKTRSPTAAGGQSRGFANRAPRAVDPIRGADMSPRSGDRGRRLPLQRPDTVTVLTTLGPKRLPLALLGAVLATLIVGAGYVVFLGEQTRIAKSDPPRPPVVATPPEPSHQPPVTARPSAPNETTYPPGWFFKRP